MDTGGKHGIGGKQLTEKVALLEELIDIRDETERRVEADVRRENVEAETLQALETRERAMERYGGTRQRLQGELGQHKTPPVKKRRSSEPV